MTILIGRSWNGGAVLMADTTRTHFKDNSTTEAKKLVVVNDCLAIALGGPGSAGTDKLRPLIVEAAKDAAGSPEVVIEIAEREMPALQKNALAEAGEAQRDKVPPLFVCYAARTETAGFEMGFIRLLGDRVDVKRNTGFIFSSNRTEIDGKLGKGVQTELMEQCNGSLPVVLWGLRSIAEAEADGSPGIGFPVDVASIEGDAPFLEQRYEREDISKLTNNCFVPKSQLHAF